MTGRYTLADTRTQVDMAWQQTREQFLDNGHEPRPLDERSVLLISAFFAITWGLSAWGGLTQLIPAITVATIVSFASLRFNSFDRAYQLYLQRRRAALVLVG
jgi:hypothetical protein